jgi:hypothetical protein
VKTAKPAKPIANMALQEKTAVRTLDMRASPAFVGFPNSSM